MLGLIGVTAVTGMFTALIVKYPLPVESGQYTVPPPPPVYVALILRA